MTGEKFLRAVLKDSPHEKARGRACYALTGVLLGMTDNARRLKASKDEESREKFIKRYGEDMVAHFDALDIQAAETEAEKLLQRVAKEFSALSHYRGDLAKAAEADLFELRNLTVGKVAPDIAGEDLDGVDFKLSDYRGKVVLLDFWGDW